jgi:hypothetical protein
MTFFAVKKVFDLAAEKMEYIAVLLKEADRIPKNSTVIVGARLESLNYFETRGLAELFAGRQAGQ